MARKPKVSQRHVSAEPENETYDLLSDAPPEIDPYAVLLLEKTATADQVKSAYRKAALKYHPDKATSGEQETANKKFQEIAFAYAILSDEKRRRRYDSTGNTAESLEDDDFDWSDFFREQTEAMVNADMIEQIKNEYQGSAEEKQDLLSAFEENSGDMDAVYEAIMCSNVLEDDKRFRKIINKAIEEGVVSAHEKYTHESAGSKERRTRKAKEEESEAMELAEELGVREKLFGKSSKKSAKKDGDDDALKALIQQRQQSRSENFFDQLEAKYGGGGKSSKRKLDEPPEELFQRNSKKSKAKAR